MRSLPSAEQSATIAALLRSAGRKNYAMPIRRVFVQQGLQRSPTPGPLHHIVRRHDETALNLYLLALAMASASPWDITRDARVWARAIGHGTDADKGVGAVSKTWRRLDETYGLVSRERSGRLAKITLLDESGDGSAYDYPTTAYAKLPFDYWTAPEAWHHTLSLPAKATLLIALSLQQPFTLPAERGPAWYGISADTLDRGQRELRNVGILTRTFKITDDWVSPTVQVTEYKHRLNPPFRTRRRAPRATHLTAASQ